MASIDPVVGDHREHRPEDLLAGDRLTVLDVGEDRRLYEPATLLVAGRPPPATIRPPSARPFAM